MLIFTGNLKPTAFVSGRLSFDSHCSLNRRLSMFMTCFLRARMATHSTHFFHLESFYNACSWDMFCISWNRAAQKKIQCCIILSIRPAFKRWINKTILRSRLSHVMIAIYVSLRTTCVLETEELPNKHESSNQGEGLWRLLIGQWL
jgi:hypothetical protein